MDFILRRYKEENDYISLFILAFSFLMILVFSYNIIGIYNSNAIWTFIPVCGLINSIIIFYGVSSYRKTKSLLKGHYDINDFYKMINPIRKVPFAIEYPIGLLSIVFMPQLLMTLLITPEATKSFYDTYLLFFVGYIVTTIIYAVIRFKYFPYSENKVIKNHEIINFFENFQGGKEIRKSYIDKLALSDNEENRYTEKYKDDFRKSNILKEVKKIEKAINLKGDIDLLKEKLVNDKNE